MSVRALAFVSAMIHIAQGAQNPSSESDQNYLNQSNPDAKLSNADLNFTQIAKRYGHTAEVHTVYTNDGYILNVFHLPGSQIGLPVLLLHGILDSSDTWIIRGNGSLAITLANSGYDVWLGNIRGNVHSPGHRFLNSKSNSQAYWNFTLHEHAVYDLPATIDLVLRETGSTKLNAIAHSQGTAMFFILLSSKPEYNDKVNLLIALAPVVYLHHSPLIATPFFSILENIYDIFAVFHKYNIFGRDSPELAAVRRVCNVPATAYLVCLKGILYKVSGYDLVEVEPSFAAVVVRHFPTATSTKNLAHFGQVAMNKRFAQFDYGQARNLAAYHSIKPPEYVLKNVKSQVVLLTAINDYVSNQADIALLMEQLPNVVRYVVNSRTIMNHLDYIWGRRMAKYLFPYILDSLKMYG